MQMTLGSNTLISEFLEILGPGVDLKIRFSLPFGTTITLVTVSWRWSGRMKCHGMVRPSGGSEFTTQMHEYEASNNKVHERVLVRFIPPYQWTKEYSVGFEPYLSKKDWFEDFERFSSEIHIYLCRYISWSYHAYYLFLMLHTHQWKALLVKVIRLAIATGHLWKFRHPPWYHGNWGAPVFWNLFLPHSISPILAGDNEATLGGVSFSPTKIYSLWPAKMFSIRDIKSRQG